MRLLLLVFTSLLLLFQYEFWFDRNGYQDYQAVKQEISHYQQENEQLSHRNQLVSAEIKNLKEGFDAVEERARYHYDMVKSNEVFYRIIKE